jgi:phosphoglucomutase/phosphomannomutase
MSEIKPYDRQRALAALQQAAGSGKLSQGAVENIHRWLTEPRYEAYAPEVYRHLAEGRLQQLDDVFWTVIPFGTGGRRGRMYPIGSNAINDRTIGESAQGLASYMKELLGAGQEVAGQEVAGQEVAGQEVAGQEVAGQEVAGQEVTGQEVTQQELSCAIAYDTRHNSRHFAELCAGIMAGNGFRVYFLDDYRSTPELSYLVRARQCSCGIMVTASHNPPSDNAVKVYGESGGQLVPPHDKAVIDRVEAVNEIQRVDFAQALAEGRVVLCKDEIDAAYRREVVANGFAGPRDLKIIYSPLHGVGEASVRPALEEAGFADVEVFGPHREPNGDFPNVPGHVSNPENPRVFDAIIERAQAAGADVILATDPDCDRLGCAAPLSADPRGGWATFTGNQIGALLADFVLEQRQRAGSLSPEHYIVKTLVTTELTRRIADSYGVRTEGNLQVGFKWIAQVMDQCGPEKFVFGTEESHGYLVGQFVRDKDGAVAALLMAQLAAAVKATGKSLHEKLESLYWQHGYHEEGQINLFMEGSEGMARMQALMELLRSAPPAELAGIPVAQSRDYLKNLIRKADGSTVPLNGPPGNMVIFDLAEPGNYVAVRPSGTEPKVKFYTFAFVPAEQLASLEDAKREMAERTRKFEADLRAFAVKV